MGCLEPYQEGLSNLMSPLTMSTFGLFLLSLINNNNMHGPKLPPNESPKTFPRHYLQQTIDNGPYFHINHKKVSELLIKNADSLYLTIRIFMDKVYLKLRNICMVVIYILSYIKRKDAKYKIL